jgi:hypothetical protein
MAIPRITGWLMLTLNTSPSVMMLGRPSSLTEVTSAAGDG